MNLFFDALNRVFDSVEKRESGPAWMDKTSDEYYAKEVTEAEADAQDSLFGLKTLTPREEQQLRGWE